VQENRTPLGKHTVQHSLYPVVGGEGASCPLPRTPPQLSAFQASGFGPSGLLLTLSSFFTIFTLEIRWDTDRHIKMRKSFVWKLCMYCLRQKVDQTTL